MVRWLQMHVIQNLNIRELAYAEDVVQVSLQMCLRRAVKPYSVRAKSKALHQWSCTSQKGRACRKLLAHNSSHVTQTQSRGRAGLQGVAIAGPP